MSEDILLIYYMLFYNLLLILFKIFPTRELFIKSIKMQTKSLFRPFVYSRIGSF